jgi:hypothetical protein
MSKSFSKDRSPDRHLKDPFLLTSDQRFNTNEE